MSSNNSNHSDSSPRKSKTWKDGNFEQSIHLRDIFGSMYSFEDDPSVYTKGVGNGKQAPKRTSSGSSAAAKPGSPETKLRQRKLSTDRIRRPIRNTTSQGSQEGAAARSESPQKCSPKSPVKRSRSIRSIKSTMHTSISIDSTEGGIPMSSMSKPNDANQQHHTDAGEASLVTQGRSIPRSINLLMNNSNININSNSSLVMAEEGMNQQGNNHNNTSQLSFFQDEPSEEPASPLENKSPIQQPLVVKPPNMVKEPPKVTCCISCALFFGITIVAILLQIFSLLLWPPEPVLLPQHYQDTQTAAPVKQQIPMPPPPEEVFEIMLEENDIMGQLPPETLHVIKLDQESPQALAFRWFHADPHWKTYSNERRRQRFALAVLYFATNPPFQHTWKHPGHWLSYDISECEWSITTDGKEDASDDPRNLCRVYEEEKEGKSTAAKEESFVVTTLPLQDNNLQGQLPMEVSLLTFLNTINLRRNVGLSGKLPEEWCKVSNLQFDCAIQSALTSSGVCGCGQCSC